MDSVGIDHCLVNPGGYWQMLEFLGDDRPTGVERCNDFLGEMSRCSPTRRTSPAASIGS